MIAIRFTIAHDDRGGVRVEHRQPLEKRVAVIPRYIEAFKGRCGFWVELRDNNERVLYRDVMHDPTRVESPGDIERARSHPRDEDRTVHGLFSIVVPALPNASAVVVMASRPANTAARPILTIPLGEM